jgi:hypothetical protein
MFTQFALDVKFQEVVRSILIREAGSASIQVAFSSKGNPAGCTLRYENSAFALECEHGMTLVSQRVRQNYLAILVAAIVCFLIEAAWYSYFLQVWLAGIGHDMAWLTGSGVSPALQYATFLLAAALTAACISAFTQLTGVQTGYRGMKIAFGLWLGCVFSTLATEYAFELRSYKLFAINAGFWLVGMVAMGAIVGVWKKK